MQKLTIVIFLSILMICNISCRRIKISKIEKESTTKESTSNNINLQETPKRLTALVDRIAIINEVQYEHIGVSGTTGENYINFKRLKEIATTNELVALTNNINETVACYASWALVDKSYPNLTSLFNKFLLQDRHVMTFNCCEKSQDNISVELYHRYWNSIEDRQKPTDKILIQLDSSILYSTNPHWLLLRRALDNRIYQGFYKKQIAFQAFDQGRIEAIYYLSNWHKAEYAVNIKNALIQYLKKTDYKKTGITDYYETIDELFKFQDPDVIKVIIDKMKKDKHWEMEKERFKYLLEDNYIYDIDNE